jgi:glycosyltransferase involved in cell wall biosynthesis
MKIAIPNNKGESGASNFLNVLKRTILSSELAKIRSPFNPFHDVALFSSVARNIHKKPYVLRLDGIYYDLKERYGSNKKLNYSIFESINNANSIIFQSEFSKSLVQSHYGSLISSSEVILNGIDIKEKNTCSENQKDKISNKKIILCSAKWRGFKRLDATIKTVDKLRKEINCELQIIGDTGGVNVNYNFVKCIGDVNHSEINNYLENADLFLHLAWLDNCPNSVIEAIGARVPVVCSNIGGTREIIEATQGGIVSMCDPNVDYSQLVDLHNPPKPNYDILVSDIIKLFEDYGNIVNKLDTQAIDIRTTAIKYVDVLKRQINRN